MSKITKTPERGMAAVYARYSSHSQSEQSVEGQLTAAYAYAASHNYTIVREYIDRAQSGRSDNRDEFQQMLKDTAKKQFSVIIVWKVDRFGRNREEVAINKMRCRKNGVNIEYVAETIPQTPEGVILESVLEGIAEYYSLQLSQNVRRGMAKSAEKCQVIGGSRLLGYKTGADKKYVIDEETAPIVRYIFSTYAAGATSSEIRDALNGMGLRTVYGNPFSHTMLNSILKNEKYRGIYNNKGLHIPDGIPRLVDDDLFFQVQDMMKRNQRPSRTWTKIEYLLSDKLICGKCGTPMFGESGKSHNGTKHTYYACSNRKRHHTCNKKAIRQHTIEKLVTESVETLLYDQELFDLLLDDLWKYCQDQDDIQDEIASLTRQKKQVESAIKNLIRGMEVGIITEETKSRMDELSEQLTQLNHTIEEKQTDKLSGLKRSQVAFFLTKVREDLSINHDVQKRLIDVLVKTVTVYDDYLEISFQWKEQTQRLCIIE